MGRQGQFLNPGVSAVLGAALFFGAGTPLAKLMLNDVSPWLLAGLFYLGSGIGLTAFRLVRRATPVRLGRSEVGWLAGAILAGGIAGPVLLMYGLAGMPASGASLLLNAEAVFTMLLAWIVFREHIGRRIALGMIAIIVGVLVLSWPHQVMFAGIWPVLSVLGACLAWGLDNNLTRKVSLTDATWIASVKGMVAGTINLALALFLGDRLPDLLILVASMSVGFLAYGVSLTLFVVGLRQLGTARTGAYFSVAPFFGALIAVATGDPVTVRLAAAGMLMAVGVWLHLSERHDHEHHHAVIEHFHEHSHEEHHQHLHESFCAPGVRHAHWHRHESMVHSHAHFPDAHHRDHRH
jgi:drug/metabolite transporter (DMT)-like permease